MAKVSKHHMNKNLQERMFDIFYETLANLSTKKAVKTFLFDLLSPSEQIMLSKRLAIATLLIKGETYRSISSLLKVSTSTVMSVSFWLDSEGGGYKKAVRKILQNESVDVFINKADEFIESVLVPRPGSNWSEENSRSWQNRLERKRKNTL